MHVIEKTKHGKTGGSGSSSGSGSSWVNRVVSQTGCGSKWITLSELKRGSGQSGCELGRVDLYFSQELFFFF